MELNVLTPTIQSNIAKPIRAVPPPLRPESTSIKFQIVEWYCNDDDKKFIEEEDEDDEGVGHFKRFRSKYDANDGDSDDDNDEETEKENTTTYDSKSESDPFSYDDDREDDAAYKVKQDQSKFTVYIFGKDIHQRTYCLEVQDFTPYFYVKLPDYCDTNHATLLEDWVRSNMWKKYQDSLLRTTFLEKYSFRTFTNKKKFKFVRLVFSNTKAMRAAVNLFQERGKHNPDKIYPKKVLIPGICRVPRQFDLYENMIHPMIKFIHHRELKPVGWLKIAPKKYRMQTEPCSYCDYNIQANWTDICSYNDINNTKIKVMAYDIECDSSHGDFPLPIKDYTKLARELFDDWTKNSHHIPMNDKEKLTWITARLESAL